MTSVCVIGAGISGLASVKSCLELGLVPYCYETCKDLGGLWNFEESKLRKNGARLYSSLVSNLSREMTVFSDFPMPKEYPLYLTWKHFYDYLGMYADEFDLRRHIKFQHKILNVEEIVTENKCKWRVIIRNKESGEEFTEEFDKVIICVGQYNNAYIPDFIGAKSFLGQIMHSSAYTSEEDFTGKNVIVVGSSNSGCDIAVEVGESARNTYLSSRQGAYVIGRLKQGYPIDMDTFSRFKTIARNLVPEALTHRIIRKIFNTGFNHKTYGLESSSESDYLWCSVIGSTKLYMYQYFSDTSHQKLFPAQFYNSRCFVHPDSVLCMDFCVKATSPLANLVVNDYLPLSIARRKVLVVPEIEKIDGKSVYLTNGTILEDVDVIISATGYKPRFPFISDNILPGEASELKMHKFVFPLNVSDPTSIAVVGCYPSAGESRTLTAEMQSRYAASVLAGRTKLPTMQKMQEEYRKMYEHFTKDGRFGYQVPPQTYSASMAEEIGVYPHFFRLLFSDPRMAFATCFGPTVPYIYRLVGPNSCPRKVRSSIFNATKNSFAGFNKY